MVCVTEHIGRIVPGTAKNKAVIAALIETPFPHITSHIVGAIESDVLMLSNRRRILSTVIALR